MKKLFATAFLCSCITLTFAQTLTRDDITDKGGYGENKLKNAPKKVYIASFRTFFHVMASADASSIGGSYKGNTKTSMTVAISGVDTPDFMEITNAAYKKFTDDLKVKGYEILTADDAAKSDEYTDWIKKEGGQVSYAQVPGYVSAVPSGYSYFIKKETKKGREKSSFLDKSPKISRDLEGAIVIDVNFAFPFLDMKTASSNMLGFSAVKAKVDFELGTAFGQDGMAAVIYPSMFKFVSSEGMGKDAILNVRLKGEGFDIEAPVFKDKKFKEMTAASMNSSPNYYGIIFQNNVKVNVSHYAECDGALYKQEALRLMNEFTDHALTIFYDYAKK